MKNDPLEGCEAASAECIKSLFKALLEGEVTVHYSCMRLTVSLPPQLTPTRFCSLHPKHAEASRLTELMV